MGHVLQDGLAIKTDLLDWLDKNVTADTDTKEIQKKFSSVQAELCLDTNALLLASLEQTAASNIAGKDVEE